jgi:hypothetical protein
MRSSKLVIAFLFLFTFNLTIFGQKKSDIGLIYNSNELLRLNLEFRTDIKEKWKLKLGYAQGAATSSFWNSNGEITLVSDSLIIERFKYHQKLQFTLYTGFERRLKESMFSFSGDLLLSYLNIKDGSYNQNTELQEDGSWQDLLTVSPNDYQVRSLRKTNFINPGVQFKFSMDIPIEDVFFIHLFVGQTISTPIYLNENIIDNPLNEFTPQPKSFILNSTSQAGIGLRYRFN